jgi:penicillin V acylase-like amidase (Ntn superfamily)
MIAEACTSIGLTSQHQAFGARNFDWSDGQAFLVKVPKHTQERALALPHGNKPMTWRTHYGAVYITMAAHHKPALAYVVDGMNTQGLSMAVSELSGSQFQTPKAGEPVIGSAQLPARIMSDCASVQCALHTLHQLTVVPSMYQGQPSPVHYMLRDAFGDSAVVAYQHGHLIIHHPLKLSALTNTPYLQAVNKYHKKGELFGYHSLARFTQAAQALQNLPKQTSDWSTLAALFTILIQTEEPANSAYPTQWSVVRNQTHHIIYWQTQQDPRIRWLNLNTLSFNKHITTQSLSLQIHHAGNVNSYFK